MKTLKHIFVFLANDIIRMRRKWLSLPLIYISPLIFVTLVIWMASLVLIPDEEEPVSVGVVNLDDSDETSQIVSLMVEATDVDAGLTLLDLEEQEAYEKIENDEIAAYIVFPAEFFTKMIRGEESRLEVVGNPNRMLESHVINEMIETVVRHIRSSQANILTINHYADSFGMDAGQREALMQEQFINFFLQTLSSGAMMEESESTDHISSGYEYFIVNGMFIIISIWTLMTHLMLVQDVRPELRNRMKMFGATYIAEGTAKIILTSIMTFLMSILFLYIVTNIDGLYIADENFARVSILIGLYIFVLALIFLLIDWMVPSYKAGLMAKGAALFTALLFSGALIPRIYFPLYMDVFFDLIFSYQALKWIEDIMLGSRFSFELDVLFISIIILSVILIAAGLWKERRTR